MFENALKFLSGGTGSIILGALLLIFGIWFTIWKSKYEKAKAIEETENAKNRNSEEGRDLQKSIDADDKKSQKAVDDFLSGPKI